MQGMVVSSLENKRGTERATELYKIARTKCRVARVATLRAVLAALLGGENARTVGQPADARDLWL